MTEDHRLNAIDALNLIRVCDNPAAEMASASEATAYALLYIGDQLAQLVEQQKLANMIAAGDLDAFESEDEDALVAYVRGHITKTVNPDRGNEARS